MKRKSFRVLIALVLALSLSLVMAVPAAATISSTAVAGEGAANLVAGVVDADYNVSFDTDVTNTATTITVTFPSGYTITEGVLSTAAVQDGNDGTSAMIYVDTSDVAVTSVVGDASARTIVVAIGATDLSAGTGVSFRILIGITNPTAIGGTGTFTIMSDASTEASATATEATITHDVATKYVIIDPTDGDVDAAITVTVELQDQYGNLVTTGGGEDINVTLNADGAATGDGVVTITTGTGDLAISDEVAETVNLSLTDSQTTGLDVTSTQDVLFDHSTTVATLTVEVEPTAAVAGVAITPSVQVKVVDSFGNPIDGESVAAALQVGTGTLTGTTPQTTDSSGIATFDDLSIDLLGADKVLRFTATEYVDSAAFAITPTLTVTGIDDPVVAGVASDVIVTALDANANIATGYTGTVTFTSSDTAATLPANYTFLSGDNGVKTFTTGVTLETADEQTVTATDTATGATGTQIDITVDPGVAVSFVFDAIDPQDMTAFDIIITALDAYGNTATDYTGTPVLSDLTDTIDPAITSAFSAGVRTENVTIAEDRKDNTITATDGSILGTSSTFNVYDELIALNADDAWTLISTDDYIISSGGDTSAFEGTVSLKYVYTGSSYVPATVADIEPVEALYVKTTSASGWLGLNYSTASPGASTKDLVAGWNLISSAYSTASNAQDVLSGLQDVAPDGTGLATLVSQDDYNLNIGDLYIDTSVWGDLSAITLNAFDGYWIYMNAAKSFGVIPQ